MVLAFGFKKRLEKSRSLIAGDFIAEYFIFHKLLDGFPFVQKADLAAEICKPYRLLRL